MALTIEQMAIETAFKVEPVLNLINKNLLIKDRYRVLNLLFETSKTNVFKGIDVKKKRHIFIYVTKNQFFRRNKDLRNWIQDIKSLKKLRKDAQVFEVFDIDLWKKKLFLVTNAFEGIPMIDLIHHRLELPIPFVLNTILNLAECLKKAKRCSLSTSLSKEDLYLSKDGSIQLLKFQKSLFNNHLLNKSDTEEIYFLSCLLYELLMNKAPFEKQGSTAQLESNHLLASLRVRKDQVSSDIFTELSEIFVTCAGMSVENSIDSLDKMMEKLSTLLKKSSLIQEDHEEKIEKEELNSAFDVVNALRGEDEIVEALSDSNFGNEYSRIWRGLDVENHSKFDSDLIFKSCAFLVILLSFAYKLYF
ncbi:MAG: hypothetical protein COB02_03385 [Candidatus Cloacimonadota bacterium]|nr:MAG: hypothetical protein COB02_03385 [Candidatus Cloacimonadota bacterium]